MTVSFKLFLLFVLGFLVYKSADLFISGIKNIAKGGFLEKFFLASIFAGIVTSLPEIFVALNSSLIEDSPTLAIGNALGSNIANLGVVVPLSIFLAGKPAEIKKEDFELRNLLLVLSATVLPFMLVLDRVLSFYDGIFLISMFFIYTFYIFDKKNRYSLVSVFKIIKRAVIHSHFFKGLVQIILSLVGLILGTDFMVKLTLSIGNDLGLSAFLSGLVFIALTTSLPELFVAVSSIAKGEKAIFLGDILGSLVTNANLVVALTTLKRSVVFVDLSNYAVSTVILFTLMSLFFIFSLTKRRIDRWEGVVLFSVYILFLLFEKVI